MVLRSLKTLWKKKKNINIRHYHRTLLLKNRSFKVGRLNSMNPSPRKRGKSGLPYPMVPPKQLPPHSHAQTFLMQMVTKATCQKCACCQRGEDTSVLQHSMKFEGIRRTLCFWLANCPSSIWCQKILGTSNTSAVSTMAALLETNEACLVALLEDLAGVPSMLNMQQLHKKPSSWHTIYVENMLRTQ